MKPYYEDNQATIYNADNMVVLPSLASDSIDLTVTSPPYDNLRKYKGHTWDFEGVAKELYRVTKPGGVVVWVVGDETVNGSETGTSFRQALFFKDVCGFNLHDTMIYGKNNPPPQLLHQQRYTQSFEYMFVFSKGPTKCNYIYENTETRRVSRQFYGTRNNNGDRAREVYGRIKDRKILGNIWSYNIGNCLYEDMPSSHPAIFPEALASDHIRSWSNPGDLILDPFMGSGTTWKMAVKNGCRFVGIEIATEYCEIAVRRLAQKVLPLAVSS